MHACMRACVRVPSALTPDFSAAVWQEKKMKIKIKNNFINK